MTEDFKETLLTYLTGNIVKGTPSEEAVFLENETVTNNLDTYIQTELGTSNFVLEKVIQSQTNSNVVILGYKSSDYSSFIVIVDKDLTPLSLITQYTSEVNFKYITGFNVDENGYFYCIEADSMATQSNKRFLMLNNISMANASGEYIVKIRKSYAVPNTTVLNGSSYLVTTIIKAISQSIYLILNSNGSDRYITKLTVNVGASNEWDDITMTGVNGVDQWASIDGEGNIYLKTINTGYPISTNVYGIGVYFYDNGTETSTTYTDGTISGLSLRRDAGIILNSTIAYVGYKVSDTNSTYTKYIINSINLETGAITNIYSTQDVYGVYAGDFNPIIFRKIDNSVLFKITVVTDLANNKFKIITGRIIGNTVYDTTLASNLTIATKNTDFFITTRNFNLYQYFTQLGNSYYSCKEVYNPNGYNGTEYQNYDILIPSLGRLYSNNKLIFARTLYNMQVNGDTTISTIEVPNNYLNEISIQPKELLGKTNLIMNSDSEEVIKNIYETVNINFMNSIAIQNNDGSLNTSGAANNLNSAMSTLSEYTDYSQNIITRAIINYTDNDLDTKVITNTMFTQTGTTGQYEFIIYVPNGKIVDNIQFTNYNYMTVFNTITNLNLEGGKYYKIIQPVEVI
jgi:hypothetical protein